MLEVKLISMYYLWSAVCLLHLFACLSHPLTVTSAVFFSLFSPFDKDDQASSASTVNKPPSVNKRFSTYNQSPPDTPSLREQAFYVSQIASLPTLLTPPTQMTPHPIWFHRDWKLF